MGNKNFPRMWRTFVSRPRKLPPKLQLARKPEQPRLFNRLGSVTSVRPDHRSSQERTATSSNLINRLQRRSHAPARHKAALPASEQLNMTADLIQFAAGPKICFPCHKSDSRQYWYPLSFPAGPARDCERGSRTLDCFYGRSTGLIVIAFITSQVGARRTW